MNSRGAILERFPEPIALAFRRAVDEELDPVARFAATLDAYEILVRLLAFAFIGELGAERELDPAVRHALSALSLKGRLTTGDWSRLVELGARTLRGSERGAMVPGLARQVLGGAGTAASPIRLIEELCQVRNREWGHGLGRDNARFASLMPAQMRRLEDLLGGLDSLEEMRLCVPTRITGDRILEARLHRGTSPPRLERLDSTLVGVAHGDRLGVDRSVLLVSAAGETAVLFPFVRYSGVLEGEASGLYLLAEWNWARYRDRPRLKSILYMGGRTGGVADQDRALRGPVEAALLPLLEGDRSEDGIAALPEEDPDWSIPSVWAEHADAIPRVVGREAICEAVAKAIGARAGGLLVITGPPGSGKSYLAHALFETLRSAAPILHTMKGSRSPRALLRSLLHQCGEALGRPLGDAVYRPERIDDLRLSLERQMQRLATERAIPCVAVVDGVDELAGDERGWPERLEWLPRAFPAGVHVVLTCRPDAALLDALRLSVPPGHLAELEVPPLDAGALGRFLEVHWGVTDEELSRAIDLREAFERSAGNPLHLRVILDEASRELAAARSQGRRPRRIDPSRTSPTADAVARALWQAAVGGAGPGAPPGELRERLLDLLALGQAVGMSVPLLRAVLERLEGREHSLEEVTAGVRGLSTVLRSPAPGRFLPFHVSFAEFLRSRLSATSTLEAAIVDVLVQEGRRVDEDYWAAHLSDHAGVAGLEGSAALAVAADRALMRARAARGLGAAHGTWLRQVLDAAAPADADACIRNLEATWGPGRIEFEGLRVEEREEVAEAFEVTGVPRLARAAREIHQSLAEETGDPTYLRRFAWVSYQALDDWAEAESALLDCVAKLDASEPVEAARARRLLAGIAFDSGSEAIDPEVTLQSCLATFRAHGLSAELGMTLETLGVVVDAEGRWEEAERHYIAAAEAYEERHDRLGRARVDLNRSIAALFTSGLGPALALQRSAEKAAGALGGAQFREYLHAQRALMLLLSGDMEGFDAQLGTAQVRERWVQMTLAESVAVRRWFAGDHDGAASEMDALGKAFDRLDDAWGAVDMRVNKGLLEASRGDVRAAVELLDQGLSESATLGYRLGEAMAASALERLGERRDGHGSALQFYERHLERLFGRVPSPFVPCYVLLLP